MKKNFTLTLFLSAAMLTATAQDFKLYYAKNVTDVTQFQKLDILDKELQWREVANKAIDGNQKEVYDLTTMLSSTRMKGLADQEQFWRLRDHSLLCFRINDGQGKTGAYNVEVNYGLNEKGVEQTGNLTVSRYFFANIPKWCQTATIKVWSRTDKKCEHPIMLRYSMYDWNNDNLYLFQLDQKRQATGDTYKMEYVTSFADANGESQSKVTQLELKETCFQSFYVPQGHTLTDVFLLTGNAEEGDVRLRLNMDELVRGIDTDYRLDVPKLTTTFQLDKHENREMVSFNWLGTGLFEKYDTLYMKLYNQRGTEITQATINVHRVDQQGHKVDEEQLTYCGYDRQSGQHKILTYGHPAYVEIVAPGCLPTLFRYKGAADADSKIVSEDLCSAKLTLRTGRTSASGINISDQYLRYLKDEALVVARGGVDYAVCTKNEMDLAAMTPVDTLAYMDNAGNDYPKLFENKPVTRFAQMEVVFSSPKGGSNPTAELTVEEIDTKERHTSNDKELTVVSAAEFNRFQYDYYFLRLSLVDVVPHNKPCHAMLTTPTGSYTDFPVLMNVYFDPDEEKEKKQEIIDQITQPKTNSEDVVKASNETALGLQFPPTFSFELGPFKMKTGLIIDVLKQTWNMYVSGGVNTTFDKEEDEEKLSKVRDNAKAVGGWYNQKFKAYPNSTDPELKKKEAGVSLADAKLKFEDWVLKESGSIFDVNAGHIGWYLGGGFKISVQGPLSDITHFQLNEASLFAEGGYGTFFAPSETSDAMQDAIEVLSFIGLVPDLGFVFDTGIKMEAGLKSFDTKMASTMSAKNMGLFANLTFSSRVGAWVSVRTPKTCIGGLKFGLRAGAKAAIQGGIAVPLDASEYGMGANIMLLGIVETFVELRALFFHWNASLHVRAGKQWLFPDDASNPFHKDFPFWLEAPKTRTIGNSFRTLKALEPSKLGTTLLTGVASDANPHFLDQDHIVYNTLGKADDYNDDHVTIFDMKTLKASQLSDAGTAASQHMRSKRGTPEVVVYQQLSQAVNSSAVTDENAVALSAQMMKYTQIKSKVHQSNGSWKTVDVTPDDGYVDQQPVVTIQEDGKAAVVYQHGQMTLLDETVSADSAFNHRLTGELQLRTFDGTQWSEPTKLFDISLDSQPSQYDLIMRGDTVLVGVSMTNRATDKSSFKYASVPLKTRSVSYVDEDIEPLNFFMNRVGRNSVIAMLYERPDTTRDVYIRTLGMDGHDDGRTGCDIGLGQSNPDRIKIICDRDNDETNDFAVLWTESNNIIRDAAEGNSASQNMGTMLNASRVRLSEIPSVTYPLTVGGEQDSLFLTDFDGFLDDDRINVVYTLTDIKSGSAMIMQNEKHFTNSFEADVTYSREALMGSKTLPVNVEISNTGTSAIESAQVIINGLTIDIEDAFVAPLKQQLYVVQYPIPDDFDGYMESEVKVTFQNVFKTNVSHARGRNRGRNLLTMARRLGTERVTAADVDCNVVCRDIEDGGVNTFVVELTDRSSRGMTPGTGVLLGFYPHPAMKETLNGQAQTLVKAEDFKQTGGVRKAYATVYIQGITEPVAAYIVPQIVDLEENSQGITYVANIRSRSAAPRVNLFPSSNPTKIVRPQLSREPEGHRVKLTTKDDGVTLSHLTGGQEVRIFNAQGFAVFMGKADASTLFVPLSQHGAYVISTGDEVFKFLF